MDKKIECEECHAIFQSKRPCKELVEDRDGNEGYIFFCCKKCKDKYFEDQEDYEDDVVEEPEYEEDDEDEDE